MSTKTSTDIFKDIIIQLLELSLMEDCEMYNMGDWNIEDLVRHSQNKKTYIEYLKNNGNLNKVPNDILAEAFATFKINYRIANYEFF